MELPVGVSGRIEQVVIPGPRLRARPIKLRQALIVRLDGAWPHGANWRYDLTVYGLEPGQYSLLDYLEREDGRAVSGVKPLLVRVRSVLPAGRALPNPLPLEAAVRRTRYRVWLTAGVAVWLGGLLAILLAGRGLLRRAGARTAQRPPSLADRLRPLVVKACRGELNRRERAALERMLITYWRKRLGLDSVPAHRVMHLLRQHAEAGPLVRQLEAWLHRPQPASEQDIHRLLAPYQHVHDPEPEGSGPIAGVSWAAGSTSVSASRSPPAGGRA